ncbi:hypothetical protein [Mycobacterium avium]|uniref:hypothetical protein n=1 Tax=Mycobacterium avium TaxID=1764 RepID=UPI000ADE042F|nr:hypothetical protein [Mycobacterium avium]MBG0729736.1 hypothetical protein [Mycobacterium avium]QXD07582.1 hypothetical protein BB735_008465 [Mycobacterium avium subsp. hominissuis]
MDPLERALTAFAYSPPDEPIGQPITFHAPEDAEIHLPSRVGGHPLAGMVIATWERQ